MIQKYIHGQGKIIFTTGQKFYHNKNVSQKKDMIILQGMKQLWSKSAK